MPLLLDGLYVNLAYTHEVRAKYFMRHGSSRFLFKLDSEYYSRFPFLLLSRIYSLSTLSLCLYMRLLIFPFVFLMKNPSFLEQFVLDSNFCLFRVRAHTNFLLFPLSPITCVSDFPISALISSLSYLLSYFACFYSARYANNAMTTTLCS